MASATPRTVNDHVVTNALRFIAVDLVWEFLYLPIWWYTRGVMRMARYVRDQVADLVDSLGFLILVRNFTKPMFGDYTRSGKIISFFIRLIQIVIYAVIIAVWCVVLAIVFVGWLLVLPFAVYNVVYQLVGPILQ
ncbi:MAG: hypothetical protein HY341_02240 [Candidatus Kerfeldbacteria bacterium]|nr:hypothetical protein [Candidatus Kerfeldbacteria bacterium]